MLTSEVPYSFSNSSLTTPIASCKEDKARQERERVNRIEHNVEAKMDEYPPKYFHGDIKGKNK